MHYHSQRGAQCVFSILKIFTNKLKKEKAQHFKTEWASAF